MGFACLLMVGSQGERIFKGEDFVRHLESLEIMFCIILRLGFSVLSQGCEIEFRE